jgi:hypothetical protein
LDMSLNNGRDKEKRVANKKGQIEDRYTYRLYWIISFSRFQFMA